MSASGPGLEGEAGAGAGWPSMRAAALDAAAAAVLWYGTFIWAAGGEGGGKAGEKFQGLSAGEERVWVAVHFFVAVHG